MMSNLIACIGKGGIALLLGLVFLSGCSPTTQPSAEGSVDQVISRFFHAVAADDIDAYTSLIKDWNDLDELSQQRIIQDWKTMTARIEEGGGLEKIDYSRLTVPLELVLKGGAIEVRQPLVFEDGQWSIRP